LRLLLSTASLAAVAVVATLPAAAQTGGGGAQQAQSQPAPPPPPLPPALVVGKPAGRPLVREGQGGRLLLGGTWYFRQDNALQGEQARFFDQSSLVGWTAIGVPHNWNGADASQNKGQQGVGWYRKEFRLPRPPRGRSWRWKARFESVNNRATVWLNGRKIGAGGPGYLPFELDLAGLRKGRNRLVVRVSNRRGPTDLTHWRVYGNGGWWNFGGISREVYLRPMDAVDIEDVVVMPKLRSLRGGARIGVRVRLRNLGRRRREVRLVLAVRGKGRDSREIPLSPRALDGQAEREFLTSFTIPKPRLWRPRRPALYDLTVAAAVEGRRVASFRRAFGVRKIERTRDGRVLLNGRKLQLRGASIHEDDVRTGAALSPRQRFRTVRRLRQLNATVARAHYPLHPAFLEAFDRYGILFWSQAPVYQLQNELLDRPGVRAAAVAVNRRMVLRDRSHPSVLTWSLGNELALQDSQLGRVGPGFARFLADASREVRRLDPTRLVALDRHSRIGEQLYWPALAHLDALGINEYFGWYKSSVFGRPASGTADLAPFLDQLHAAYPRMPLFVTEFGAESTDYGPLTEKGTFEFQNRYLRDHLAIHASRPFVNGSMIWILRDFRVHPGWTGGNSAARSTPPWNNKGLIDQSGARKPAFFEVSRIYRRTRPLR
jgi:beta-glucuronidase